MYLFVPSRESKLIQTPNHNRARSCSQPKWETVNSKMLAATAMVSSLVFTKKRKVMQVFPESVRKLWNNWEVQVMVLLSLTLQGLLVLLGTKRKYSSTIWHRILLWLAYLSADGLATISLSVLSDKEGEPRHDFVEPKYIILALWAQFLLLHLGGPDTITAYSMEDNELWQRHLLKFGVQVGVAVYIFLRAWTGSDLNLLGIPVFIAGIIKAGERTWVLWSASSSQFKESLFPEPDPGPNYARYMEDYISKETEGYEVCVENLVRSPAVGYHNYIAAEDHVLTNKEDEKYRLDVSYYFFETFKRLFADLILSFHDVSESRFSLQEGSSSQVFKVIEVELGFMYDVFYTKALVIYSAMGAFLRLVSLLCNIAVLCVFCGLEKNLYPKVDVFITYVLLVGAIFLELYSAISLLFSDWTMLWLIKHKNMVTDWMSRAISSFSCATNRRWSNRISQFNLISFCMEAKKHRCGIIHNILSIIFDLRCMKAVKRIAVKCCLVLMIIRAYQSYQKFRHIETMIVHKDLKKLIFDQFYEKIKVAQSEKDTNELQAATRIKNFCAHRGDKALESSKCLEVEDLGWSVQKEFDQSILLWDIATELCYNYHSGEYMNPPSSTSSPNFREKSKWLSEYMLYLLVQRPFMLPDGIGKIKFQNTCADAIEFIKERKTIKCEKSACQMLWKVGSGKVLPSKVKGDKSKSVLFDACRLAKSLRKLEEKEEWGTEKMCEVNRSCLGGNARLCCKPLPRNSPCSAAQTRWGAAHSCLASYGASWHDRTVSDLRRACKDQISDQMKRLKCLLCFLISKQ